MNMKKEYTCVLFFVIRKTLYLKYLEINYPNVTKCNLTW